jgi:hypothetical protein
MDTLAPLHELARRRYALAERIEAVPLADFVGAP